ncbi:hypothetical protein DSO57_1013321 [Entomophthora muscae]|uniref:Uncharacterized protein n=1 Tax=Entomophthora muscae TaxID=34485 RepID=A0ACC2UF27_9FUNG|nr:hypothetical protein DSO57_1013321 [Entomophthora muscae]
MKLSLLAVALPLIAECVKFRLDVSRHRGYGAPTFLNRRPNRICFRRVKKSNNTSSSQQPKYDNAAPKEKGPYNESPETDVSPDINQMPKYEASDDKKNEQPKDSDHSNQMPKYEETTQTNSPKKKHLLIREQPTKILMMTATRASSISILRPLPQAAVWQLQPRTARIPS